jgi:negative regulator of sigma E activity
MPTGPYGQFSAEASVRLPTGAYGTMNYRSPYRYLQSPMTPVVPRGQLPRQAQPTPVNATIPTRWFSVAAAQATGTYGTTNYRNALRYPSTMVRQSSVTPVVPRGQLPRQAQPTPVNATIPTRWCSTAAAQANQPLCR